MTTIGKIASSSIESQRGIEPVQICELNVLLVLGRCDVDKNTGYMYAHRFQS